jgi:Anti-sigma-K factor rskA/Putative zinc-finger
MSTRSVTCAECRTLLGGYVLDALEPDEAEAVRRHLADCPDCAVEHANLAGVPDLLALVGSDAAGTAERPPPTLEEAVLDRFAREHRADRTRGRTASPARAGERRPRSRGSDRTRRANRLVAFRRALPAAAAGALAAAAIAAALIAFGPLGGGSDTSEHGEAYQARLVGSPAAPGARAFAKLETSDAGTRVWLRVNGLPGNPNDLYELWCVRDDGAKISAGTFRVNARGQAAVDLTTAAVPGEYHVMSVERKPGERVMTGAIQYGSS